MAGEVRERTRQCRELRDRLSLRQAIKIQEHLIGVEATVTARIGPTAASPSVRECVLVLGHDLADVMCPSHSGLHTTKARQAEGIATGDKAVNSLEISNSTV